MRLLTRTSLAAVLFAAAVLLMGWFMAGLGATLPEAGLDAPTVGVLFLAVLLAGNAMLALQDYQY